MKKLENMREAYSKTKRALNESIGEFLTSEIFDDIDQPEADRARYFAAINILTSFINDVAGGFAPDIGQHEFEGFLDRISKHYLHVNQIRSGEEIEYLNMTKCEFDKLMESIKNK